MIALLWATGALGADVMVHVDHALRTPPVLVFTETTPLGTSIPTRSRLAPSRAPLDGGIGVQFAIDDLNSVSALVVDTALYGWHTEWAMEPEAFDASVFELRADVGVRTDFRQRRDGPLPPILGYGSAGIGGQLTVFSTPYWPTHLNPALHTFGGLGISMGGQQTRVFAEVRLDAAVRIDHYEGLAQRPEDQLGWTYYPGHIGVMTQVGVHFRGSRAPVPVTADAGS